MTKLLLDALQRIDKLTREQQDFAALLLMRYVALTKIDPPRSLNATQMNERIERLIHELVES